MWGRVAFEMPVFAVSVGPLHGYGMLRIQQISGDRLEIAQESFYIVLYRIEHKGWIEGEWGEPAQSGDGEVVADDRGGQRHPRRDAGAGMIVFGQLRSEWRMASFGVE